MNFPSLVLPYQRPPLWYTPLSVFTQTMPPDLAAAICESEALALAAVFLLLVLVVEGAIELEEAGAAIELAGAAAGAGVDAA